MPRVHTPPAQARQLAHPVCIEWSPLSHPSDAPLLSAVLTLVGLYRLPESLTAHNMRIRRVVVPFSPLSQNDLWASPAIDLKTARAVSRLLTSNAAFAIQLPQRTQPGVSPGRPLFIRGTGTRLSRELEGIGQRADSRSGGGKMTHVRRHLPRVSPDCERFCFPFFLY